MAEPTLHSRLQQIPNDATHDLNICRSQLPMEP